MAAESMSVGRIHELEADIPVREGEYGDRVRSLRRQRGLVAVLFGLIGYLVARAGELAGKSATQAAAAARA